MIFINNDILNQAYNTVTRISTGQILNRRPTQIQINKCTAAHNHLRTRTFNSSQTIQNETLSTISKPRKPSPYRLLTPHTFLASFAPLHVAGWRLDVLASKGNRSTEVGTIPPGEIQDDSSDLQGRRLVRVFDFPGGKDGWRELMEFTTNMGDIVEQEDHHPSIIISPASDYPSLSSLSTSTSMPNVTTEGYMVEVSTHTHTPMPPLSLVSTAVSGKQKDTKMNPGITGKDIKLAERLEGLFTGTGAER